MNGRIAIVLVVWLVYGAAAAAVIALVLFAPVFLSRLQTSNDLLAGLLAELIEQGAPDDDVALLDNVTQLYENRIVRPDGA